MAAPCWTVGRSLANAANSPAGEQTSLYCAFLVNIRNIAYLCNVFNIYTFYENIK